MRLQRIAALGIAVGFLACSGDASTGTDANGAQNGGNGDLAVVASVVVTPGSAVLLAQGATVQLSATARDSSGSTLSGKTFLWTSSDSTIVTVNASGLVTAMTNALSGSATIRAATEGVTGAANIEFIRADVIEGLIAQSFNTWWMGTQVGNPAMALSATADEFTLSWGNYGIRQLSSEPRTPWPNTPTFQYAGFNEDPWFAMYSALSAVYDGIRAIEANPALSGQGSRALAFAKLVQGLAHGWLALMFDQAFVLDETVDLVNTLQLKPYSEVWTAAVAQLEEAITIADTATFTLPSDWINGNALTNVQLVQLAHSQLARWMPQVARTPAERDAVDWNAVINHVDLGIQQDFVVQGDGDNLWWSAMQDYGFQSAFSTTWSRADYKTIGWTDVSGGFSAWLAAPTSQRTEFLLDVPDRRITNGTATGAGSDFGHFGPSAFPASRGTYHYSLYGGTRYESFARTELGPIQYILTEEMQLNKAEGMLRLSGPSQAVADIINATRVTRGQLTPATTSNTFDELMDMIIYERRIESYGVCSGCAFFDRRGLGPLAPSGPSFHHGHVEGTPLHFPVPGKELEVLGLPNYTFGGIGNELTPPSGTFSSSPVPAMMVYAFPVDPPMSLQNKIRYLERHAATAIEQRTGSPER